MKISPELEKKLLEMAGCTVNGKPVVPPEPIVNTVSEADFMQTVIDYARKRGWKVFHCFDSRKSEAGFPDLVLVRDCVLYAECKTETGKTTADQDAWIEVLTAAGQTVFLWRPSDWPEIVRILQ